VLVQFADALLLQASNIMDNVDLTLVASSRRDWVAPWMLHNEGNNSSSKHVTHLHAVRCVTPPDAQTLIYQP
jgi:hypothetical protein